VASLGRSRRHSEHFDEFFEREFAPLVAFVIKAGFRLQDAEDAAAEAMVCACRRWADLVSPRGWVRKAAYHIATNQAERGRDGVARAVAGGWCERGSHDDADRCAIVEEQHEILRLLARLPKQQRLAMALYLDGFDNAEIAEQLDVSPATVRSTLRHARERLKTVYLEREAPPPVPIPRGGVNRESK
jgi:RNA polymerase sigma factor (sigma-70 family)